MEWIKLVGMVLVSVVLIAVLKQYNPVYAILAALACCTILFVSAMGQFVPLVEYVSQLAQRISTTDILPVLKAVGIVLLAQIARDVCKDAGQNALAGQVELAARVLVMVAALPLFQQLLELISGLLV